MDKINKIEKLEKLKLEVEKIDSISCNNIKKNIEDEKLYIRLRNRCLYLIADCMRTEKNIRDKIKQGKTSYPQHLIDKVIDNLKTYNYINDEEFTKRFIEINKNKYSYKIIKQKLYLKGVNKNIIDNYLSEETEDSQTELAKKILYKKCKNYNDIKNDLDYKQKSKLYAYLIRKGFSYEIVDEILK